MSAVRQSLALPLLLLLAAASLAGCTRPAPVAEGIPSGTDAPVPGRASLISLPRPPIVAATDRQTLPLARLTAERTRWSDLYQRLDARRVSVDALPFLYRTAEGQRFLGAGGPRAIARGMPAEICPATVTTLAGPGTDLPDLAERALGQCIDRLRPDHPDCGCRILAIGEFLTVPREDMSFATGTTARLHAPALGLDAVLVAEHAEDGATLLRGLAGPLGSVRRGPGAEVAVILGNRRFAGRSIPVGYRRGRIAERIYATDAEGRRLSLLIGFSPDELEQGAATYLLWPATF